MDKKRFKHNNKNKKKFNKVGFKIFICLTDTEERSRTA